MPKGRHSNDLQIRSRYFYLLPDQKHQPFGSHRKCATTSATGQAIFHFRLFSVASIASFLRFYIFRKF